MCSLEEKGSVDPVRVFSRIEPVGACWVHILFFSLFWALGFSGVYVFPQRQAHAGACCASAAAFGVGRLLRWEKFSVGLRTSVGKGLGRWDSHGKWLGYRSDYGELEWRTELWGMVGFGKHVSLYARFPWLMNHRYSGELDSFGGGIGDLQAGVRWDLSLVGGHSNIPGIALTLNILAPAGQRTNGEQSTLGTEITSRGGWAISAGLLVERVKMPWFIQLQVGVGVPLPFRRTEIDVDQRFGVSVLANLANGWELIANQLVFSVVLRLMWEDRIVIDGMAVENSSKIETGAVLALAWRFEPHWTLQLSVDSGVFLPYLGKNVNGRITTTLGVRYGFF